MGLSVKQIKVNTMADWVQVYGLNSTLLTADQQAAYNNFFAGLQSQIFPPVV